MKFVFNLVIFLFLILFVSCLINKSVNKTLRFKFICLGEKGLISVWDNEKKEVGVVNVRGLWVLKPQYKALIQFSEGYIIGLNGVDSIFCIDIDGNKSHLPGYPATCFCVENGLIALTNSKNKKGFVNHNGEWVIQPNFKEIKDFSLGLAPVMGDSSLKFGYIDKTGKKVIDFVYEDAMSFSKDTPIAGVQTDTQTLFIDNNGRVLIDQFDGTYGSYPFSEGVIFAYMGKEKIPYYVDENFNKIRQVPNYKKIDDFDVYSVGIMKNGLIVTLGNNGKFGYMNRDGKWIIQPQYGYALPFENGYALVCKGGRFNPEETLIINTKGEIILSSRDIEEKLIKQLEEK